MTTLQAIFLGVIQGLTEFLPVSSSGHLAIAENLLHIRTDGGMLFDVMLHVGTLSAIFIGFRKDIGMLIGEFIGILSDLVRKIREPDILVINSAYRRFVLLIIASTIPTGILGFAAKDFAEYAGSSLLLPGIGLLITSALLFLADRVGDGRKSARSATFLDAFEIGMAQGIATLPGISRSGATITACLLCGFKKEFAVKYSFIMSIPAILGALILELKDIPGSDLPASLIADCVVGMIVSGIVGFFALKFMVTVVRRRKYMMFSIYCLVIGAISIGAYFIMK
ncbi:MAG: undecaprenyl-diphosphate phosphatase [Lachnospiraceae bacterium]|nr:undecaprenyl-diphosphate phosphatase [Lachnospiraceae bacterium]